MNQIDDDLLLTVEKKRSAQPKIQRNLLRFATAAACICVIAGGIQVWSRYAPPRTEGEIISGDGIVSGSDANSSGEKGVTIPQTKVSLDSDPIADMIGFFIYEGRVYVAYEAIEGHPELVGDLVGRATGTIDEWTKEDGYVDFAGSVTGDFYTVKGFSPEFMLCMVNYNDSVITYINDNGLTLRKGADLFEERLHLSGNYSTVEVQTQRDWYYGTGNVKTLCSPSDTTDSDALERFIAALNEGDFVYTDDVPLENTERTFYDRGLYHLFFRMDNGMKLHLVLYKGGYVRFNALIPVCVKMDEGAFNDMIKLLDKER